MSRRRRGGGAGGARRAVVACMVLVACEAGGGGGGESPKTKASASASATTASLQSVLGAVPPAAAWTRGERQTFSVELHSAANLEGSPFVDLLWKGKLVSTTVQSSPTGTSIHFAPADVELTTALDALRPALGEVAKGLKGAFGLELDAQGILKALRYEGEPSSLITGLRQSLAASLQATRRGSDRTWIREEQDGTGRYDARYDLADNPLELKKKKLEYKGLVAASADPTRSDELTPKVVKSDISIRLDADGSLQSVESSEELSAGTQQMMPVRASTRIVLRRLDRRRATDVELAEIERAMTAAPLRALGASGTPAMDSPQADDARIGKQTLPEVLATLRVTKFAGTPGETMDEKKSEQHSEAFGALCAMVRRRSETVPVLTRLIEKGDVLAPTAIDALGCGGTAEAQRAVAAVLARRTGSEEQLASALVSLSQTPRPTEEATARLASLLDEKGLRIQAYYGLGTHARVLREAGEEQRAARILAILVERLERAKDPLTRMTALRAIANSANENALPAVKPFLRAEVPEPVREAAVESLHGMHQPEVDGILTRTLKDDPAITVRRAAARAMSRRAPNDEFANAARTVLREEKNPNLRADTLRVLTKWLTRRPALASTIGYVATNDAEESIRTEAKSALDAWTSRKP